MEYDFLIRNNKDNTNKNGEEIRNTLLCRQLNLGNIVMVGKAYTKLAREKKEENTERLFNATDELLIQDFLIDKFRKKL